MKLADRMAPHIRDALLEVSIEHRDEVSDALAKECDFEQWRLDQEPVVDDTPANRANYISLVLAQGLVNRIRRSVETLRADVARSQISSDLDT